MVEVIARKRVEVAAVERPAFERNADANLPLFVAFTAQRKEANTFQRRQAEQRATQSLKRRGLVIATIEAAKNGANLWNANGCADARVGGVLADEPAEVREAHATVDGEPLGG